MDIEFQNNGLTDSLTHTPAPAVFFENLEREFARSKREKSSLSIISIQAVNSVTVSEPALIALARTISRHVRGDEFFTRISETGFWIAVRAREGAAGNIAQRIVSITDEKWRTSIVECAPSISVEEWISSVDRVHFS